MIVFFDFGMGVVFAIVVYVSYKFVVESERRLKHDI